MPMEGAAKSPVTTERCERCIAVDLACAGKCELRTQTPNDTKCQARNSRKRVNQGAGWALVLGRTLTPLVEGQILVPANETAKSMCCAQAQYAPGCTTPASPCNGPRSAMLVFRQAATRIPIKCARSAIGHANVCPEESAPYSRSLEKLVFKRIGKEGKAGTVTSLNWAPGAASR